MIYNILLKKMFCCLQVFFLLKIHYVNSESYKKNIVFNKIRCALRTWFGSCITSHLRNKYLRWITQNLPHQLAIALMYNQCIISCKNRTLYTQCIFAKLLVKWASNVFFIFLYLILSRIISKVEFCRWLISILLKTLFISIGLFFNEIWCTSRVSVSVCDSINVKSTHYHV